MLCRRAASSSCAELRLPTIVKSWPPWQPPARPSCRAHPTCRLSLVRTSSIACTEKRTLPLRCPLRHEVLIVPCSLDFSCAQTIGTTLSTVKRLSRKALIHSTLMASKDVSRAETLNMLERNQCTIKYNRATTAATPDTTTHHHHFCVCCACCFYWYSSDSSSYSSEVVTAPSEVQLLPPSWGNGLFLDVPGRSAAQNHPVRLLRHCGWWGTYSSENKPAFGRVWQGLLSAMGR